MKDTLIARLAGLAAALAAAVFLTTGCSTLDKIVGADDWMKWQPESTALQIAWDGKVTETIMDKLDEGWYSTDELQNTVAESVKDYNASHDADSITVTQFSAAGGAVRLVLSYKTGDDYASFNNLPYFDGSMLNAEMAGFLFSGTFNEIDKDSVSKKGVPNEEVLSHKEYDVSVADTGHAVQVPGQIRYLSSNAEPVNSHTAVPVQQTTGETEKDTSPLQGADGGKQEQSPEEKDASYLYVVYEKDAEPQTRETQAGR